MGKTLSERTLLTLQSVNNKLKSSITRNLFTSLTSANCGAHFPHTLLPPYTSVQGFVDERLQQLFGAQSLKSAQRTQTFEVSHNLERHLIYESANQSLLLAASIHCQTKKQNPHLPSSTFWGFQYQKMRFPVTMCESFQVKDFNFLKLYIMEHANLVPKLAAHQDAGEVVERGHSLTSLE